MHDLDQYRKEQAEKFRQSQEKERRETAAKMLEKIKSFLVKLKDIFEEHPCPSPKAEIYGDPENSELYVKFIIELDAFLRIHLSEIQKLNSDNEVTLCNLLKSTNLEQNQIDLLVLEKLIELLNEISPRLRQAVDNIGHYRSESNFKDEILTTAVDIKNALGKIFKKINPQNLSSHTNSITVAHENVENKADRAEQATPRQYSYDQLKKSLKLRKLTDEMIEYLKHKTCTKKIKKNLLKDLLKILLKPNDWEVMQILLGNKPSSMYDQKIREEVLLKAVAAKQYPIAKCLLEDDAQLGEHAQGRQISQRIKDRALRRAAKYDDVNMVKLLLDYGASLASKDRDKHSALNYMGGEALESLIVSIDENQKIEFLNFIKDLAEKGDWINMNSSFLLTGIIPVETLKIIINNEKFNTIPNPKAVFLKAIDRNNTKLVEDLILAGINIINIKSSYPDKPLDSDNNYAFTDNYGRYRHPPNPYSHENTVLHYVINESKGTEKIKIVKFLLKCCPNLLKMRNSRGDNPLDQAVKNKKWSLIVGVLNTAHALQISIPNCYELLLIAIENRQVELVRIILRVHSYIIKGCSVKRVPLYRALNNNNNNIVTLLLEHGHSLFQRDADGEMLLDVAFKKKVITFEQVVYLLTYQAWQFPFSSGDLSETIKLLSGFFQPIKGESDNSYQSRLREMGDALFSFKIDKSVTQEHLRERYIVILQFLISSGDYCSENLKMFCYLELLGIPDCNSNNLYNLISNSEHIKKLYEVGLISHLEKFAQQNTHIAEELSILRSYKAGNVAIKVMTEIDALTKTSRIRQRVKKTIELDKVGTYADERRSRKELFIEEETLIDAEKISIPAGDILKKELFIEKESQEKETTSLGSMEVKISLAKNSVFNENRKTPSAPPVKPGDKQSGSKKGKEKAGDDEEPDNSGPNPN